MAGWYPSRRGSRLRLAKVAVGSGLTHEPQRCTNDKVFVSYAGLITIRVQVYQISYFNKTRLAKVCGQGLRLFALWVVNLSLPVLFDSEVVVGKWNLLVGKLVSLSPDFSS